MPTVLPFSSSTITTPPARPPSSLFSARVRLGPSFLLYCSPHQRSCIFPFVHTAPLSLWPPHLVVPSLARVDITGARLIDIPSTLCETGGQQTRRRILIPLRTADQDSRPIAQSHVCNKLVTRNFTSPCLPPFARTKRGNRDTLIVGSLPQRTPLDYDTQPRHF